jgi:hypothetical protein
MAEKPEITEIKPVEKGLRYFFTIKNAFFVLKNWEKTAKNRGFFFFLIN